MNVRAKFKEIYSRVIPTRKQDDTLIYQNGDDNMYPYEIEGVIRNSPIAFSSAKMMSKFISGMGVEKNIVVNSEKNYKLTDVVKIAAKSISYHNSVAIYVGYGIDENQNLKPNKIDILDICKIRLSKEDSEDNKGRIFYKNYLEKQSSFGKKKEAKWFYPFNKNEDVVLAQIKRDCKEAGITFDNIEQALHYYRGQVMYLNLTPEYTYSLSTIDAAFNDADTDYRISLYTNKQVRTGFLGKTVVVNQGLSPEAQKDVDDNISEFLGAENSASIYQLSVEQTDNLDNIIKFIQLKPQIDDKLFVETKSSINKSILRSFNNIPEPLISAGEGSLFGTNSDTYSEMKRFYTEQTLDERVSLQDAFTLIGFDCKIIPIL